MLVVVALAIEYWAWQVRLFQGWLFMRPDLRGTWSVTIESEWIDPQTGKKVAPISGYAAIAQTNSRLQIQLMTLESESCLLANSVLPTPCGNRFEVSIVYANTPHVALRGVRSERHVGAAILQTHGVVRFKPDYMTAEYWTDRRTVGRMAYRRRTSQMYSRFEDARAALG